MVTGQQMGEALMELMPAQALVMGNVPDDAALDVEVRRIIGESNLDVEAVFAIGNTIMAMAVQAEQDPESTVVGAFVTGVALMAILHRRGALT